MWVNEVHICMPDVIESRIDDVQVPASAAGDAAASSLQKAGYMSGSSRPKAEKQSACALLLLRWHPCQMGLRYHSASPPSRAWLVSLATAAQLTGFNLSA